VTASVLGQFHPADSAIHRLGAGTKLALLGSASIAIMWLDRPWQVALAVATVLFLYLLARIPHRVTAGLLRHASVLALLLGGLHVLSGTTQSTAVIVGQLVAVVLLAALVTATTRTADMAATLVAACRPVRVLGVDPERVGLLLMLGVRTVPVILALAHEVSEAQLARGLRSSPRAFAVPLLVRCLRHADATGEALAARGVDD
jgi:biotin transport system permease protein